MSQVVEDFEWTRDYHRGDLTLAAYRLQISESALERMLYRAKHKGYHVGKFHRLAHD
jgi:lipocalin